MALCITAGWDDVPHLTAEQKAQMLAAYPEHEREARSKGVPKLGSGAVFPIAEEQITIAPFAVPRHWPQINGIDFGWDHPFAAVNLAWDRDADCVYVCKAYRQSKTTPVIHAAAIRPWGAWVPCAWPHDGYQHDKGSGDQLAKQYGDQNLNMLGEHATHQEGGFGIEAGIMSMLDRMQTGRLKVFANLNEWFDEYRMYHRKDGQIVKEVDDLMSATRIGCMMLRFAKVQPQHGGERRRANIGHLG